MNKKEICNPFHTLIKNTYKKAMEAEEAGENMLTDLLDFISDDNDDNDDGFMPEPKYLLPLTDEAKIKSM